MTDDAEALFGGRSARPSFTDRVTRGQFLSPRENLPPPAAPTEQAEDSHIYKPYGFTPANTVGETCEIRGWVPGTDIPQGIVFQYRFLMQIGFVGDEMLKLMLPDCIVVLEGRHLGDLRLKLGRRVVTFIQEHNQRLWSPALEHQPLIRRLEIARPGSPQ